MAVLHKDENIEIRKIVTGDFENNAYLVVCPKTNESVIIDAPAEPERVLDQAKDTNVQAVLFTHTHFDHIDGAQALKDALGVPLVVHPDDEGELPVKADQHLEDEGAFSFGNITFRTIHNPGHTPGATSLVWGKHLFSGDTLFPGGPGYTTSPENFQQLLGNVESKLLVLDDDINIYPGHGEEGILSEGKRLHAGFKSRSHPDDIHGHVSWDS